MTPADLKLDTNYEGLPSSLIIDGQIMVNNLQTIGLDRKWLTKKLSSYNIDSPRQVLFAALNTRGDFIYQTK